MFIKLGSCKNQKLACVFSLFILMKRDRKREIMNCSNCGKPVLENDMFCANCGSRIAKEDKQINDNEFYSSGLNNKFNNFRLICSAFLVVVGILFLFASLGIKPELEWTSNGLEYVNKGEAIRWFSVFCLVIGGLGFYGCHCISKATLKITESEIIGNTASWMGVVIVEGIGMKIARIPLRNVKAVSGKASIGRLFVTAEGKTYTFYTSDVDKAQKIILERMGK